MIDFNKLSRPQANSAPTDPLNNPAAVLDARAREILEQQIKQMGHSLYGSLLTVTGH